MFFFFFKQKTAYEITVWLEFRRVLFRSGVTESNARSTEGQARITLEFEPGWDMARAGDDVEDRKSVV